MSSLILEKLYYPVKTLGFGNRLGLWVRGCGRRCPGCISPQYRDYAGQAQEVKMLIRALPEHFSADGLTISGGEPFDQAEGLAEFAGWFRQNVSEDILIFTGYSREELLARGDCAVDELLRCAAVLIDGPYIEALNDGIGLRGSANQRILVQKFPERYQNAHLWKREVQFVAEQDRIWQIGIPPADERGNRQPALQSSI